MEGRRIISGLAAPPADHERELALEGVKIGYACGHLTDAELEARAERILRARTRGELALRTGPLPLRLAARYRLLRIGRRVTSALLRAHAALYLTLSVAVVGIWALTGAGTFWPAWLVVPGAAFLAWHAVLSRRLSRALARRELPRSTLR